VRGTYYSTDRATGQQVAGITLDLNTTGHWSQAQMVEDGGIYYIELVAAKNLTLQHIAATVVGAHFGGDPIALNPPLIATTGDINATATTALPPGVLPAPPYAIGHTLHVTKGVFSVANLAAEQY